jgi:hypothetical protein
MQFHEIKLTKPDWGGEPHPYIVCNGQRQSVPPGIGATAGKFVALLDAAEVEHVRQLVEFRELKQQGEERLRELLANVDANV